MAETTAPPKVHTEVFHLTFDVRLQAIPLGMLISRLDELNQVLHRLWKAQALPADNEKRDLDEVVEELAADVNGAEFEILRINFSSPLELALGIINAPKHVVKAVAWFLKSIVFHEEVRQKLAAQGATEWEKAVAERLKNVETAVRISQRLSSDGKPDPYVVAVLIGRHENLQHGPLALIKVEVEGVDE